MTPRDSYVDMAKGMCAIDNLQAYVEKDSCHHDYAFINVPYCSRVLNGVLKKGTTAWVISFLIAYAAIVVVSYYLTFIIEKYSLILFCKNE